MVIFNKSFLKFVNDFGPLAIFFFYYYNSGKNLSVAIPPLIVATIIAVIVISSLTIGIKTYSLNSTIYNLIVIADIAVTVFFLIEIRYF